MKFKKEKVSLLDGRTAVVFTYQVEVGAAVRDEFSIRATGEGVEFQGRSSTISDMEGLQQFAKVVSEAWKAHLSLKPRLDTSLSGH